MRQLLLGAFWVLERTLLLAVEWRADRHRSSGCGEGVFFLIENRTKVQCFYEISVL